MITEKQIEAKDIKRLLLRVYRRYNSGAITEAQAYKETYLLNSVLKAIEVTDLEERLQRLETALRD
ncbi:MAG: hypothetical protein WC239_09420 [Sphaerochaetaceae bacterium]|jgi:hypothetical protein